MAWLIKKSESSECRCANCDHVESLHRHEAPGEDGCQHPGCGCNFFREPGAPRKEAESVADEKRDVDLAESIEDDAEDVEEKAEDIGDKASDLSEHEQKEVEEMEKHFGQIQ